ILLSSEQIPTKRAPNRGHTPPILFSFFVSFHNRGHTLLTASATLPYRSGNRPVNNHRRRYAVETMCPETRCQRNIPPKAALPKSNNLGGWAQIHVIAMNLGPHVPFSHVGSLTSFFPTGWP